MSDENTIISTINTATGYNRAYHDGLPANVTLPASVVQLVSGPQMMTHDGPAFRVARYQISCWAETKAASLTLAAIIENVMTRNMTAFELSLPENKLGIKDPETGLYQTILDFFVWE